MGLGRVGLSLLLADRGRDLGQGSIGSMPGGGSPR